MDELTLLDWKRRVFELYAEVRAEPEPEQAWRRWRDVRDELFRIHPQSPLPGSGPLPYYDYDPALRLLADVAISRRSRALRAGQPRPVLARGLRRRRLPLLRRDPRP